VLARAARYGTLLRVSRLADDLPQVAELDLNPVIVRADGVIAVDARIRATSEHLSDPFLRNSLPDRRPAMHRTGGNLRAGAQAPAR
jgi:hypothetical protein